ncbi:MAG TPA: SPOR domain-containing protein [Allosphingosinicella sp.]
MTDIRADSASLEDDRLPWLEAVEEDDAGDGPSPLKMIVGVLIALAAIGAVIAGLFWLNGRAGGESAASGEPELIRAPQGDYKTKPDQAGGMQVEGEGITAFAASEGVDPKGAINTNAVAEAPVTEVPAAQPQQPAAPKADPKQATGTIPAPAPTPAAGGGATVQLGAFSSQASANAAWKAMAARFRYLAPLTSSIVPVQSGGKTLYRLRASGPGAADICGRLRVAGESCVKID